jgi:hypothetical protein
LYLESITNTKRETYIRESHLESIYVSLYQREKRNLEKYSGRSSRVTPGERSIIYVSLYQRKKRNLEKTSARTVRRLIPPWLWSAVRCRPRPAVFRKEWGRQRRLELRTVSPAFRRRINDDSDLKNVPVRYVLPLDHHCRSDTGNHGGPCGGSCGGSNQIMLREDEDGDDTELDERPSSEILRRTALTCL